MSHKLIIEVEVMSNTEYHALEIEGADCEVGDLRCEQRKSMLLQANRGIRITQGLMRGGPLPLGQSTAFLQSFNFFFNPSTKVPGSEFVAHPQCGSIKRLVGCGDKCNDRIGTTI